MSVLLQTVESSSFKFESKKREKKLKMKPHLFVLLSKFLFFDPKHSLPETARSDLENPNNSILVHFLEVFV